jgi:hypothetical protein
MHWDKVIEEYEGKSTETPSFRTLAAWLRSSLAQLAGCHEVIHYGILHIYRVGVPHTHLRISNAGTKENLDISLVTTWVDNEVTHKRIEGVNLLHTQAPAHLSGMLTRLTFDKMV